jgi:hypothetical protein
MEVQTAEAPSFISMVPRYDCKTGSQQVLEWAGGFIADGAAPWFPGQERMEVV